MTNTELFLENYPVDLSTEISTLITFELDDVRDFSSRTTSWSKTIPLPGTINNNKLFGHIFQAGQSNDYDPSLPNVNSNFNASKSASCIIFQDNIQTFKGVLRLTKIRGDKGRIEYDVAVFGELNGLNVALSSGLLENLDFSAYDQNWNETNIINSWFNTPGSGVYFPNIDYGTYSTNKHDWDFRSLKPALFVREYIDKMFTAANFRWSSDIFNSARFKGLIVPHNQKILQSSTNSILLTNETSNHTVINTTGGITSNSLPWDVRIGGGFSYASGVFTYIAATTVMTTINLRIDGTRIATTPGSFTISIRKNGVAISSVILNSSPVLISYGWNTTVSATFATGDTLDVFFQYNGVGTGMVVTAGLPNSNMNVYSDIPSLQPVSYNQLITLNDCIPKNVRQVDFLVSIIKLFNIYIYEDKFDKNLLYLKPYIDFYSTNSADSIDWSYKFNRDKPWSLSPMSELNAKIYNFKYKKDTDYYNDLYTKRYSQNYGDYIFDSQFEFTEQSQSFELIFSGTPLVGYDLEDKIYPTICKISNGNEEVIDSNIRIMQSKKISGVTSWDIKDGSTVLASTTDYGYAGHFDDPDAPDNDLNFGVLKELFFILIAGDLTKTQFNLYWSGYMAEITDKNSKLLSGNFKLTNKDIYDLDFSKFIFIDGVLYRLNKIIDFNMSKPLDTVCELIKVNYLIY